MPEISLHFEPPGMVPAISNIPDHIKPVVREGFSVLARIPSERFPALAGAVAEQLPVSHLKPSSFFVLQLGVSRLDVPALAMATSLLTSAFIAKESPSRDKLLDELVANGILRSEDRAAAVAYSIVVEQNRELLDQTIDDVRTGNRLLPSLASSSAMIDLRPRFSPEGKITRVVPVAIVSIFTDSKDDLWFQMNRTQLQQLISELQEALQQLDSSAEWVKLK